MDGQIAIYRNMSMYHESQFIYNEIALETSLNKDSSNPILM